MGFEDLNCAFHVLNLVLRQQLKTACGVRSLQQRFEHSARASGCTVGLLLFEDLPLLKASL